MPTYDLNTVLAELKTLSKGEISRVPLPDDALIAQYERETGFTFPEDYKVFLKKASNVSYGLMEPLYLTTSTDPIFLAQDLKENIVAAKQVGVPADWLPICYDNGDFYCIVPDGRVRFWSHNGYSDESWEDLAAWIKQVWIDEYLQTEEDDKA
ncbi:SMI1/KNR4 family protein [Phyllobacterium zundukense]|uniref:SMI1/KNR4 family protein n=1 Tax=Phyllobacterium zundukense TaxID=1867719 RepID=A0ACD4D043_9HYPH|nr:SMI1/KNR4 family protein [Phyllobacterium zundukense]UXN59258.1 SMI1/KNR4 family protein [Phyllobacterium zundukense]